MRMSPPRLRQTIYNVSSTRVESQEISLFADASRPVGRIIPVQQGKSEINHDVYGTLPQHCSSTSLDDSDYDDNTLELDLFDRSSTKYPSIGADGVLPPIIPSTINIGRLEEERHVADFLDFDTVEHKRFQGLVRLDAILPIHSYDVYTKHDEHVRRMVERNLDKLASASHSDMPPGIPSDHLATEAGSGASPSTPSTPTSDSTKADGEKTEKQVRRKRKYSPADFQATLPPALRVRPSVLRAVVAG